MHLTSEGATDGGTEFLIKAHTVLSRKRDYAAIITDCVIKT
jgi:hypothetical protein